MKLEDFKNNIFVISDTHFFHQNIFEYEPDRKQFGDKYISEITKRWNSVVKENDLVFHLGDVFCGFNQFKEKYPLFKKFTEKEIAAKILSKLNGIKILIRGNHDKKTITWYKDIGFSDVYDYLKFDYQMFKIGLCHYPLCEKYVNSNSELNELKNLLNDCEIYIHGHTHSRNPCNSDYNKLYYNVSVENINYTPLNLIEIINDSIPF